MTDAVAPHAPNRTLSVVRMQLINRQTFIWVPLIVLSGSLVISLAIYALLRMNPAIDVNLYGGGAQAPLWYFLAVGVQALTMAFPFSQAMSVTRHEFYVGTLLTAALTSLGLAVVFVLGGLLETVTNGWGLNGYFFKLDWIWADGPFTAGLLYFTIALLFFVIGFWAATIYKRFGTAVLTATLVGLGLLAVAAIWAITRFDAWGPLWTWVAGLNPLSMALSVLALIVLLAGGSYLTLRRAVP